MHRTSRSTAVRCGGRQRLVLPVQMKKSEVQCTPEATAGPLLVARPGTAEILEEYRSHLPSCVPLVHLVAAAAYAACQRPRTLLTPGCCRAHERVRGVRRPPPKRSGQLDTEKLVQVSDGSIECQRAETLCSGILNTLSLYCAPIRYCDGPPDRTLQRGGQSQHPMGISQSARLMRSTNTFAR